MVLFHLNHPTVFGLQGPQCLRVTPSPSAEDERHGAVPGKPTVSKSMVWSTVRPQAQVWLMGHFTANAVQLLPVELVTADQLAHWTLPNHIARWMVTRLKKQHRQKPTSRQQRRTRRNRTNSDGKRGESPTWQPLLSPLISVSHIFALFFVRSVVTDGAMCSHLGTEHFDYFA